MPVVAGRETSFLLTAAVGVAGQVSLLRKGAWVLVSVLVAEAVPGMSPSAYKSEPSAL